MGHLNRAKEMAEERLLQKKEEDVESMNQSMLDRVMTCMTEDERCAARQQLQHWQRLADEGQG